MESDEPLLSIYGEVDRAMTDAGFSCSACGRCCDFHANDYVLCASSLETELVVRKTGRRPALAAGRCCFQDAAGACTIHRWRPLGCRTFFCAAASSGAVGPDLGHALHEQALERIRKLSGQNGREWRYGRFFEGETRS